MNAPSATLTATAHAFGHAPHSPALSEPATWPLDAFERVWLEDLAESSLQDRVDSKFAIESDRLLALLPDLAPSYRVLEVAGLVASGYRSVYYDTPHLDLYRMHHAGRRDRYKVRGRRYDSTAASFLEVKHKTHGRTVKSRIGTVDPATALTDEGRAFLAHHFPGDVAALVPTLENRYVRVALVGIDRAERVTLDVDLRFEHDGHEAALPGVAIAEIKQPRLDRTSPFFRALRAEGVRPLRISKYCYGVAQLHPVKHHAFAPALARLDRLTRGTHHVL